MFIHLKKNKKIYFTFLLLILLFFVLVEGKKNRSLKKFDGSIYLDNLTINKKDYNIFVLNHKNLNETVNFKNIKKNNILPRVAHAGGGYKDNTYTNSIEALNENKKDFLFFEIDFFLTKDNKVVCEHDFNNSLESIENFKNHIKKNKIYQQCTYLSLKDWLNENPNKIIITDFKNENIKGLRFISENFLNYEKRFIPQIYHPKEYLAVKNLGFQNIIWTLYRYQNSNDAILIYAKKMDLFAITMNPARARSGLGKLLKRINVKTYVHTINSVSEYYKYLKIYNIDQIYTDWIK